MQLFSQKPSVESSGDRPNEERSAVALVSAASSAVARSLRPKSGPKSPESKPPESKPEMKLAEAISLQAFLDAIVDAEKNLTPLREGIRDLGDRLAKDPADAVRCARGLLARNKELGRCYRARRLELVEEYEALQEAGEAERQAIVFDRNRANVARLLQERDPQHALMRDRERKPEDTDLFAIDPDGDELA